MNLKLKLNDFSELGDNVSDDVKALYTKTTVDGKDSYTLNVDGVKPIDEFNNVYSTLQKVRGEKDTAEKSLKAFGDWTPEKIQGVVSEFEQLKSIRASATEEDFVKRLDEVRSNHQKQREALQAEWAQKELLLKQEIEKEKQEIRDMQLAQEVTQLYSKKGDPSGLPLAIEQAKKELVWNAESGYFSTKDGFKKTKDWVDEDLFKSFPCLLKGNVSAGARGGETGGVNYEKWFNPNSKEYSDDPTSEAYAKRLELFRKDPVTARQYLAKYKK